MLDAKLQLLKSAAQAKRECGKPLWSQACEILTLLFSQGRLSPSEYFYLQLFDDQRFDWSEKVRFLGYRGQNILDRLNSRPWHAVANDKLVFYGLMKGIGVQVPELHAIYQRNRRRFGETPIFTDLGSLGDFMRSGLSYPCFGKPVQGVYGRGAVAIQGYDRDNDQLRLADGQAISVSVFLEGLLDPGGLGYVFQSLLAPAPEIGELCGERLSSIRVWVLYGGGGTQLFQVAEWKVPCGRNMVDNFGDGSNGNLLGMVDIESGIVRTVFSVNEQSVTHHPDTQARLQGIHLPQWEAITSLALQAARALPGLRFQGWDIAITDRGPIPLEVNLATTGALLDTQRKNGQGVLDDDVLRLLEKDQ